MKNKLLFVPLVMMVTSVWGYTTTTAKPTDWTTAQRRENLDGKMVAVSYSQGGITLYSPYYFSPPDTFTDGSWNKNMEHGSSSPWYTTTTNPPTSTPPSTKGWSVCLRYITDYIATDIFRLYSSSSNPITLGYNSVFWLKCDRYSYQGQRLNPIINFFPNMAPAIWTRVCVTVDNMKNVVQLFSGSYMSIRKVMPSSQRCLLRGQPSIEFSGFDGQVTDVQMWDYPLKYKEVFNYMSNSVYRLYHGSVLTWSDISYALNGNALMEDVYEIQAQQPLSSRGRGRRPKTSRRVRVLGKNKL